MFNPKTKTIEGVPQALDNLKASFPCLTKSYAGGVPVTDTQQSSQGAADIECARHLFGKGSNAAHANRLAIKNPQEYRRLKSIALDRSIL
jgi:hypothetical protein